MQLPYDGRGRQEIKVKLNGAIHGIPGGTRPSDRRGYYDDRERKDQDPSSLYRNQLVILYWIKRQGNNGHFIRYGRNVLWMLHHTTAVMKLFESLGKKWKVK